MTTFRVEHRTEYRYESTVTSSYGLACVRPRETPGQRCLETEVVVDPVPADTRRRVDFFGNHVDYFAVGEPHTVLVLVSRSIVEVDADRGALPFGSGDPWESVRDASRDATGKAAVEARHFLLDSDGAPVTDRARAYAEASFAAGRPVLDAVADLAHRIHDDFEFAPGATDVTSTIDDLLDARAGVCQDFAHLTVSCLRAMGLPGRYVSGYIETEPAPGQPKLAGADVSHAWASVKLADAGWVDVDPTNDQFVDGRYVTVAWGRDYGDVAPVKGVVYSAAGRSELNVTVDVTRLR